MTCEPGFAFKRFSIKGSYKCHRMKTRDVAASKLRTLFTGGLKPS